VPVRDAETLSGEIVERRGEADTDHVSAGLVPRAPILSPFNDLLCHMVRIENRVSQNNPSFSTRWREQTLDLSERDVTEDAGAVNWEGPECVIMAILQMTRIPGSNNGKQEQEGQVPKSSAVENHPNYEAKVKPTREDTGDAEATSPATTTANQFTSSEEADWWKAKVPWGPKQMLPWKKKTGGQSSSVL